MVSIYNSQTRNILPFENFYIGSYHIHVFLFYFIHVDYHGTVLFEFQKCQSNSNVRHDRNITLKFYIQG